MAPTEPVRVRPGSRVHLREAGGGEHTVRLRDDDAASWPLDSIHISSPLGRALIDRAAGDVVEVEMHPSLPVRKATIVAVDGGSETDRGRPARSAPARVGAHRPRAPWPSKPSSDVASTLRRALDGAWDAVRAGDHASAATLLDAEVRGAICDLSTYTVEAWEHEWARLEEARLTALGQVDGRSAPSGGE